MPMYVELNERLTRKEKTPEVIMFRHEQGAGHAAEGYAKVSGRPGFVCVTSGPASTNLVTPIAGLILGLGFGVLVYWLFRKSAPLKVDHIFRKGQLVSAALYSLGHGGNDAQKTMGIIASLLFSVGLLGNKFYVPFWVVLACHAAIALGTMFGGWRIVKTMGQKVAKLKPIDGFCAEAGAAVMLFTSSALGVPVSTTHTITGSIMGVGSLKRLSAVKWGVAGRIIWAWILTIPCSAMISALAYSLIRLIR